jgi:hypothetical protein
MAPSGSGGADAPPAPYIERHTCAHYTHMRSAARGGALPDAGVLLRRVTQVCRPGQARRNSVRVLAHTTAAANTHARARRRAGGRREGGRRRCGCHRRATPPCTEGGGVGKCRTKLRSSQVREFSDRAAPHVSATARTPTQMRQEAQRRRCGTRARALRSSVFLHATRTGCNDARQPGACGGVVCARRRTETPSCARGRSQRVQRSTRVMLRARATDAGPRRVPPPSARVRSATRTARARRSATRS